MAVTKKRWYHNIYLEFYLRIPLLTVATNLMVQSVYRTTYDVCRVNVELWKWKLEFDLYRRERP